MGADLELHLVTNGYVGLCRLAHGMVDVCGIFRRARLSGEAPRRWRETLSGQPGSVLQSRLADASFVDDSFCSVAGLGFGRPPGGNCAIGDAFSFIPPGTGNGMSLALESAALATEPLAAFSKGGLPWADAAAEVSGQCRQAFHHRLLWGRLLHHLLMSGLARSAFSPLLLNSDWLWGLMFSMTRSLPFNFRRGSEYDIMSSA